MSHTPHTSRPTDCGVFSVLNAATSDASGVSGSAYTVGGALFVMSNGPVQLSSLAFQGSYATTQSNQSQAYAVPVFAIGGSIAVFSTASSTISDVSVSNSNATVTYSGTSPASSITAMAGGIYWTDIVFGFNMAFTPAIAAASFYNVVITGSTVAIYTALLNGALGGNYSCFGGSIAVVASTVQGLNATNPDVFYYGQSLLFSNVSISRSSVVLTLQSATPVNASASITSPPYVLLLGGAM